MLEFQEEMIFLSKEEKTSQKGNNYTVVHYLGDKESFSTMADCLVPNFQKLDKVIVTFKVIPGRYLQFKTIDIEKS